MALAEASQLSVLTKPEVYFSFTAYLVGRAAGMAAEGMLFPHVELRITSVAKHIFPMTSRSKTPMANRGRGRRWK